MIGARRNMAIEKKQAYSQIGLTKKLSGRQTDDDELWSLIPPTTFKSLGPTSSTDAVIIIGDDDEKETLELKKKKKKKQRFVSWWDDVDGINELSSVVKGLPKSKDAASVGNSCFSSITNLHDTFIDLREDGESSSSSNKGRHVSLEELGVSVEDLKSMPWEAFDPTWEIRSETMDPWLGGYIKDMFSGH